MRNKQGVRIQTDRLAEQIWSSLYEDFDLGGTFADAREALKRGDIKSFRSLASREIGHVPPARFKRIRQLENLLKKYRFENDVFTSDELEVITDRNYLDNQARIARLRLNVAPLTATLVLQEARRVAKGILGEYSADETIERSKFGKKSSLGCPLSKAYIDLKLTTKKAFTGSARCANWFFGMLPENPILNRIVKRIGVTPGHNNLRNVSLVLKNVPKTWKIHRGITPLPLLDLFYTYGVGRQVQNRLKEHGLDIRHLQDRHRYMVQRFSLSRTHATADLSAASDSITSDLLNHVLPRPWYNAVKMACTHQVLVGGKTCYTESILPMGNGMTFPIETLFFYSLIRAIGNLTGIGGSYSVFGDDLIYPTKIHKYVARIFPQLGLILNQDKTFVRYPFRESCGEDFYRGAPVRSFYLRNEESPTLSCRQAEAFIYGIINGLLRRWDQSEVSRTINMLLVQLSMLTDHVLRVPPQFPDKSGIKVKDPNHHLADNAWVPYEPVMVKFYDGSRWYQFNYLVVVPKRRVIATQEPYYWLGLGGGDDTVREYDGGSKHSIYSDAPHAPISWKRLKRVRHFMHNGRLRKVTIKKYVPCVASRVVEQIKLQQNRKRSISDWV